MAVNKKTASRSKRQILDAIPTLIWPHSLWAASIYLQRYLVAFISNRACSWHRARARAPRCIHQRPIHLRLAAPMNQREVSAAAVGIAGCGAVLHEVGESGNNQADCSLAVCIKQSFR